MTNSNDKSWVIVSGAGGALGSALTRRYAAAGRPVLALDISEERFAQFRPAQNLTMLCVDLTDPIAVDTALNGTIPRTEAIALFVNAVGTIWNEPVLAMKGMGMTVHGIESWERVIRSNLTATFVGASRVAARMARRGGGAIVNFSSISAKGTAGQAAYSAAKAGIEGLTRAMAQELGPLGIRVNAIAPGFIDVATTRSALSEAVLTDYVRRTPARRLGTVDEIGDAVEYLASSTFINGTVLELDGGLRI